jgi:thymidylate kinase
LLVAQAQAPVAPLHAVRSLLDALDAAAVRHCVWKSNSHLDAALAGETDVDLLVHRSDVQAFRGIAASCGVKPLVAGRDDAVPGMEHYLGIDDASCRLFHLHVHYALVLGQKHVKNHRLPIEETLLDTTRRLHGVRVPSVELELGVLAARVLLKYRARDFVKDVLRIRSPGVPDELRLEIAWLYDQTSIDDVRAALGVAGNVVPADVVEALVTQIACSPRAGWALLRLRRTLRAALAPYERYGRVAAQVRYARALARQRRERHGHRLDSRLVPATGGRTIAVIGADGSGKSTAVAALEPWLGWKLQVSTYYLGSKRPSRRSTALYLTFRVLRRSHRAASNHVTGAEPIVRGVARTRDMLLALHFLSIARDRIRRIARGHHEARAGRIVVFDRYPVRPLSSIGRHQIFDGPHIAREIWPAGALVRRLAAIEDRLYARCPLPDEIVVLDVDASTATARKPDHEFETVAHKACISRELLEAAAGDARVSVARVDASQELPAVDREVKRAVWHAI